MQPEVIRAINAGDSPCLPATIASASAPRFRIAIRNTYVRLGVGHATA